MPANTNYGYTINSFAPLNSVEHNISPVCGIPFTVKGATDIPVGSTSLITGITVKVAYFVAQNDVLENASTPPSTGAFKFSRVPALTVSGDTQYTLQGGTYAANNSIAPANLKLITTAPTVQFDLSHYFLVGEDEFGYSTSTNDNNKFLLCDVAQNQTVLDNTNYTSGWSNTFKKYYRISVWIEFGVGEVAFANYDFPVYPNFYSLSEGSSITSCRDTTINKNLASQRVTLSFPFPSYQTNNLLTNECYVLVQATNSSNAVNGGIQWIAGQNAEGCKLAYSLIPQPTTAWAAVDPGFQNYKITKGSYSIVGSTVTVQLDIQPNAFIDEYKYRFIVVLNTDNNPVSITYGRATSSYISEEYECTPCQCYKNPSYTWSISDYKNSYNNVGIVTAPMHRIIARFDGQMDMSGAFTQGYRLYKSANNKKQVLIDGTLDLFSYTPTTFTGTVPEFRLLADTGGAPNLYDIDITTGAVLPPSGTLDTDNSNLVLEAWLDFSGDIYEFTIPIVVAEIDDPDITFDNTKSIICEGDTFTVEDQSTTVASGGTRITVLKNINDIDANGIQLLTENDPFVGGTGIGQELDSRVNTSSQDFNGTTVYNPVACDDYKHFSIQFPASCNQLSIPPQYYLVNGVSNIINKPTVAPDYLWLIEVGYSTNVHVHGRQNTLSNFPVGDNQVGYLFGQGNINSNVPNNLFILDQVLPPNNYVTVNYTKWIPLINLTSTCYTCTIPTPNTIAPSRPCTPTFVNIAPPVTPNGRVGFKLNGVPQFYNASGQWTYYLYNESNPANFTIELDTEALLEPLYPLCVYVCPFLGYLPITQGVAQAISWIDEFYLKKRPYVALQYNTTQTPQPYCQQVNGSVEVGADMFGSAGSPSAFVNDGRIGYRDFLFFFNRNAISVNPLPAFVKQYLKLEFNNQKPFVVLHG